MAERSSAVSGEASPSRRKDAIFAVTALVALYLLLCGGTLRTFVLDPELARLTLLVVLTLGAIGALRVVHDPALQRGLVHWSAVWLAWSAVCALTALDRRLAGETWLWHALGVGLFWGGQAVGKAEDRRWAAVWGMLAAAAVVSLLGAAEAVGQRAPRDLYLTEFGQARATVTLNHPNNLAGFLALWLPLTCGLALAQWRRRRRALGLGLGALAAVMLVAAGGTYSKGGQLAILAGLLSWLWLLPAGGLRTWYRQASRPARARLALALLAAGLLGLLFLGSAAGARLRLFVALLPTLPRFERWGTWAAALRMLADQPLVGVGPGCFGLAMAAAKPPLSHTGLFTHAHNWYLNLAAETGLPGALLALWLLLALGHGLLLAIRDAGDAAERARRAGLLAGLVGFGAAGLLDYSVGVPAIGLTFWMFAGLAASATPAGFHWRWTRLAAVGQLAAALLLAGCWMVWAEGQIAYLQACGALQQDRLAEAAERLETARRLDPAQRAYALVAADLALWSGQLDEARRRLTDLAERDRTLPTAYRLELARLLAEADRLPAARQVAETAVQLDPAEPLARVEAGLLALRARDLSAARAAFEAALERDADATGALAGLGEVALLEGDPAAAADWFARAALVATPRDRPPRFLIVYGRPDPRPTVPVRYRALVAGERVRLTGALESRLRARVMEAWCRSLSPPGPD